MKGLVCLIYVSFPLLNSEVVIQRQELEGRLQGIRNTETRFDSEGSGGEGGGRGNRDGEYMYIHG